MKNKQDLGDFLLPFFLLASYNTLYCTQQFHEFRPFFFFRIAGTLFFRFLGSLTKQISRAKNSFYLTLTLNKRKNRCEATHLYLHGWSSSAKEKSRKNKSTCVSISGLIFFKIKTKSSTLRQSVIPEATLHFLPFRMTMVGRSYWRYSW